MAHPQGEHTNPDYYGETASLGPPPYYPPPPTRPVSENPPAPHGPLSSHPVHPQPADDQGMPPAAGTGANIGTGTSTGTGTGIGTGPGASPGTSSKPTFSQRLHQWSVKAGVPINKMTNRLGSEAFWPSTLDKECDKAARILKSFCKDGFYATDANAPKPADGPKNKPKVLVKIPQKAIQTAAGLAVFTTFRTGLHISGAGGSGVVVARHADGTWSPPSGFLVHTLGAGLTIGVDIYDCVCVLRTPEALRAFTRPRLSLGGEVAVAAGPVGAGATVDSALGGGDARPVWSYMKSRGLYAGATVDGTVVVARNDANEAFYGARVSVEQVLRGDVPARDGGAPASVSAAAAAAAPAATAPSRTGVVPWPAGAAHLMEVLKAAEGRAANDTVLREVGEGPTPGDLGLGEKDHEVLYGRPA